MLVPGSTDVGQLEEPSSRLVVLAGHMKHSLEPCTEAPRHFFHGRWMAQQASPERLCHNPPLTRTLPLQPTSQDQAYMLWLSRLIRQASHTPLLMTDAGA